MARTILLADDSVTIQKVVELTFLDEDIRVVCFGNGADAIARLAEIRPDAVLADVHMPGADGYEVAASVQRLLPGVPTLLLVGTFEVFDAQRAADSGAAGHLKKPFDSQELLRRVKDLLASGATMTPAAAWSAPAAGVSVAAPEIVESPAFDSRPETVRAPEPAGEAPSWSFEPASVEPASVAPDTWAGVDASAFEPIEEAPAPAATLPPVDFEPVPEAAAPSPAVTLPSPGFALSDEDVERIARRVVELIGEKIVRDVAWDVVPDLAEVLLKARIRELEASVE